ncbi:MAG: peptidoglycan editing factor PgeF [Bacillota bacterium]
MELFKRQSQRRLHAEKITHQYQINLGMSTRVGGVSKGNYTSLNTGLHVGDYDTDVIENRTRVLNEMNQSLSQAIFAEQVHGNKVSVIKPEDAGRGAYTLTNHVPGVDGLVTTSPGIVLAQFYADCVPLYFFDPVHHIIGIAHAGWKGTAKGIAKTMLETCFSLGANIDTIHVVIGPAIAQANYQVNGDVVKQMPIPVASDMVVQVSEDQYLLDVKAVNAEYLRALGVKNNQITTSLIDTYSHPDLYSYRKEQQTGRMMGYIFQ